MAGTQSDSSRDPLEALAEEFVERHRRGERPSIDEYAARRPELADEIRELFPALATVERLKPGPSDVTGEGILGEGRPPRQLGDYRILREIGRGGMGVVYEAQQESLGRHVAVKILRPRFTSGSKQLARFRREARAAARLHHTNIVPVFGVGHEGDTHYYVMQLIQGQPLNEVVAELKWLREANRLSGVEPPGRRGPTGNGAGEVSESGEVARRMLFGELHRRQVVATVDTTTDAAREAHDEPKREAGAALGSGSSGSSSMAVLPGDTAVSSATHPDRNYWESVARIGVQLAGALDYAHEQGVLHRDIKPSNILVDAHGTAWVTDFGLAKVVEQEGLTESGDVVGTLRYMAPEALQGRTDARTDLRGLGLILYELIALRPAFDDADPSQLIQRISEGELTRLRQINPNVPRDLETIVMKSVDRDPADRYQTASELAEELGRFLTGEPIQARRIGPAARLWRWSKRKPLVAGLGGALALVLLAVAVAGPITAVYQASLRRTAERLLEEKGGLLEEKERLLEETEKQRVVAQRNSKMARDAVDKYLTQVSEDPRLRARGLEQLRRSLLETAREFYEQFVREDPDETTLQEEHGNAYYRLAKIDFQIGRFEESEAAYRAAIDIQQRLVAERQDVTDYKNELASAHSDLGRLYGRTGRLDDAEAAYRTALEIAGRLADERPDEAEHLRAVIQGGLGSVYYESGQFKEAEEAFEQAAEDWRRHGDDHRYVPHSLQGRALCIHCLGLIFTHTGRPKQAEGALKAAVEIRERIVAQYPNVPAFEDELAASHTGLGILYAATERVVPAEAAFKAAIEIQKRLAAEHPDVPERQKELALSYGNLSAMYYENGRLEEAKAIHKMFFEIFERLALKHPKIPEYQDHLGTGYHNLGAMCQDSGQLQEAEAAYETELDIRRRLAAEHPHVARYQKQLAVSYRFLSSRYQNNGRLDEAKAAHKMHLEIFKRLARKHPDVPEYQNDLGVAYTKLGGICQRSRQLQEAEEAFLAAIETFETLDEKYPETANLVVWGNAYAKRADVTRLLGGRNALKKALPLYALAISRFEEALNRMPDEKHPRLCLRLCHQARATALDQLNQYEEAVKEWNRAIELADDDFRDSLRIMLAVSLAHSGEHAQAVAEAQAVLAAHEDEAGAVYNTGRVYAEASASVGKDVSLTEEERTKLAEEYAAQAVAYLEKAHAGGWFDNASSARVLMGEYFAPLRGREDFQKLLKDVTSNRSPPK